MASPSTGPLSNRKDNALQRPCSVGGACGWALQGFCRTDADDGLVTTTAPSPIRLSPTVDRFLDAIGARAGVPRHLLAADIVLDATVPDWRFTVRRLEAVARQYGAWFAIPATFEELERLPVAGGEVMTYLLTWEENGLPQAAHHCHVLRFDEERCIARDRSFGGGRWDSARLAEMAAADHAG